MRLISWNVNGLRAVLKKGFYESVLPLNADVICLQETKMQEGQCEIDLPGYHQFYNYAEKKGYSGTAVFSRTEPSDVRLGIGIADFDNEGRVITCEYGDFFLVCCYTPNSQNELRRLGYRMEWEQAFLQYLRQLDSAKPVILCGDLNVAHREIDLKNPSSNHRNAGFTDEERSRFSALLDAGFVDTFRYFYPERTGAYSWWSYIGNARSRNAGWRIDYFVTSSRLLPRLKDAEIFDAVMGSDHCPVGLELV